MNNNQPNYSVYQVTDRVEGEKSIWNKIGVAWPHKNGEGFNIQLSSLPLDSKVTLLKNKPREEGVTHNPGTGS